MNTSRRGFLRIFVRAGAVATVAMLAGLIPIRPRFGIDDPRMLKIAELLSAANDVLDDLPWVEADMKFQFRTSLPEDVWRRLRA